AGPRLARSAGSEHRQIKLLVAGDFAQLVLGARLNLPHAFLGDAELSAELFQGLLAGAPQSESADDDFALAFVPPAQPSPDRLLHPLAGLSTPAPSGAVAGGRLDHLLVPGHEPFAAVILLGYRAGEVLKKGPQG